MLRPRVPTGSPDNLLNNAPLFAFSGWFPPLFRSDVFASLSIALNVHTLHTWAIPLLDLNVALVLLRLCFWLAIDPFLEPPIPLRVNSLRPVNSDIVLTILDLEGKSVQLTLQSCHYFFEGDRDIIAVFFTFVPSPMSLF
jgi:hypothetical protein